jgi:hypothetical protein
MFNEIISLLLKIQEEVKENKNIKQENVNKSTLGLTGRWMTNTGIIDLKEDGNNINGIYQFDSDSFIGTIEGYIFEDYFIFNWKWIERNDLNGVGFFHKINGVYEGGWFHNYTLEKIECLIKNKKEIKIAEAQRWVIYGKIK